MTFGHWQKRRKKIDISTFPSWGIVNPVRRPSPRCETFVADERSVSDKARPVARDGCYRLNPIINRAFSVCLCIVSSYLLVALFLLKLSLTLSLTHTHTHTRLLFDADSCLLSALRLPAQHYHIRLGPFCIQVTAPSDGQRWMDEWTRLLEGFLCCLADGGKYLGWGGAAAGVIAVIHMAWVYTGR